LDRSANGRLRLKKRVLKVGKAFIREKPGFREEAGDGSRSLWRHGAKIGRIGLERRAAFTGAFLENVSSMSPNRGLRSLRSEQAAGFGVWASYGGEMGSRPFHGFSFDFGDASRPVVPFFAGDLAIPGLCAFLAYHFTMKLRKP
jgi:hypothetical protein